MGIIKRTLACLLSAQCLLSAHEIGELLEEYEEASQLYKKTRKESLGHVIVFTREDIENLQAHRLEDLLKSVRFYTIHNNRFGVMSMSAYGMLTRIPRNIKLYINDHEVSSLHTGSPFLVWENLPLDAVEHVEIYLGIGAIELGNDPATMIIKIYTKEPAKENAESIRLTGSSRKGYEGTVYSARELGEEFSYIFLLSTGYEKRADYRFMGQNLSRDSRLRFAFLGLYFPHTRFEVGYGYVDREPFIGLATDNVAEKGYTQAEDIYITLTVYPDEERSTLLRISQDIHRRKHYEYSSTGLYIPIFVDPLNPANNPKSFYEKTFYDKTEVYISKEINSERNKLLAAASYKLYSSQVDTRYYVSLGGSLRNVEEVVPFNRQEIYSLILENQFSLSPSNLIIAGVKLDKYYRNGGYKDFNEFIARLGYISVLNEHVSFKTFLSRSYIPPYFYDSEISGRDLSTTKFPLALTSEGIITYGKLRLNVGSGYIRIKDMLVPDRTGKFKNLQKEIELKTFFSLLETRIGNISKLQAGYSMFLEPEYELSPTKGAFLRLINSYGELSSFAELVYRGEFKYRGRRIKEGYDLSAGARIKLTEAFSISLKGINLLERSSETPYLVPLIGSVQSYPVRERTFYMSVEMVF